MSASGSKRKAEKPAQAKGTKKQKKEVNKLESSKNQKEPVSSGESSNGADNLQKKETPKKEPKNEPLKVDEEKKEEESSEEAEEGEEEEGEEEENPKKTNGEANINEPTSSNDEEEEEEEEEEKKVPKKEATLKKESTPETPDAKCRAFVSNLNFKIDENELKDALKEYGSITKIEWFDKPTFKGAGIIDFETAEQAQKALEAEGKEILGRPLRIKAWTPNPPGKRTDDRWGNRGRRGGGRAGRGDRTPTPKMPGTTTVFIGNLPYEVDEDAVRDHFDDCGAIDSIRWVEKNGKFTGCGFVEFTATEATDKAVQKAGSVLGGREIRVDFANPRQ